MAAGQVPGALGLGGGAGSTGNTLTPQQIATINGWNLDYSIGQPFGMSHTDVLNSISGTGATDLGTVNAATAASQAQLGAAAGQSYDAAQGALQGSAGMASDQQILGQQALGQSAALTDYYNQSGVMAQAGGLAGQASANDASGYYAGQQAGLLGNQMGLQDATLGALGGINAGGQMSMNALGASAGAANAAAGAYGAQAADYGAQAAGSQASSAAGYGALYDQGQANQSMLTGAGYGTIAQGANAAGAVAGQGLAAQSALTGAGYGAMAQGANAAGAVAGQGLSGQADLYGLGNQASGVSDFYNQQGAGQLGYAGDERSSALNAVGRLQNFVNQGPGPSAAQAQLALSNDQTMGNAMSLANSGRGAGQNAQAMRQAMFQNAASQGTANLQGAQLRAQEEQAWRGQQLQGMGLEQGTLGALRGQDISAAQAQGQLGSQWGQLGGQLTGQGAQLGQSALQSAGQLGLGYGQLGQGYLQSGAQIGQGALQSAGQLGIGYGQLGQGYLETGAQLGQGATLGASQGMQGLAGQQVGAQQSTGQLGLGFAGLGSQETQAAGQLGLGYGGLTANTLGNLGSQNIAAMGQAGQLGLGYGQLGEQYMGAGNQAQLGMSNLAQQSLATGLGAQQGMYGLANQSIGQGLGAYTTLAGQGVGLTSQGAALGLQGAGAAAGLDQSTLQQQIALMEQQEAANMQKYGIDSNVAIQQQQINNQNTSAWLSGIATLGAGVLTGPLGAKAAQVGVDSATSDKRAKKNLRARVFDLRPAKGYAYEYIDPEMPGAEPGVHFGPMAQNLEETPAGRSIVHEVNGTKMVNTSRGALVALAALSEEQRRGDEIERSMHRIQQSIRRLESMAEGSAA